MREIKSMPTTYSISLYCSMKTTTINYPAPIYLLSGNTCSSLGLLFTCPFSWLQSRTITITITLSLSFVFVFFFFVLVVFFFFSSFYLFLSERILFQLLARRVRMNYSLESYNLLATISEACFTSNYWRAHAPSKAPSSV